MSTSALTRLFRQDERFPKSTTRSSAEDVIREFAQIGRLAMPLQQIYLPITTDSEHTIVHDGPAGTEFPPIIVLDIDRWQCAEQYGPELRAWFAQLGHNGDGSPADVRSNWFLHIMDTGAIALLYLDLTFIPAGRSEQTTVPLHFLFDLTDPLSGVAIRSIERTGRIMLSANDIEQKAYDLNTAEFAQLFAGMVDVSVESSATSAIFRTPFGRKYAQNIFPLRVWQNISTRGLLPHATVAKTYGVWYEPGIRKLLGSFEILRTPSIRAKLTFDPRNWNPTAGMLSDGIELRIIQRDNVSPGWRGRSIVGSRVLHDRNVFCFELFIGIRRGLEEHPGNLLRSAAPKASIEHGFDSIVLLPLILLAETYELPIPDAEDWLRTLRITDIQISIFYAVLLLAQSPDQQSAENALGEIGIEAEQHLSFLAELGGRKLLGECFTPGRAILSAGLQLAYGLLGVIWNDREHVRRFIERFIARSAAESSVDNILGIEADPDANFLPHFQFLAVLGALYLYRDRAPTLHPSARANLASFNEEAVEGDGKETLVAAWWMWLQHVIFGMRPTISPADRAFLLPDRYHHVWNAMRANGIITPAREQDVAQAQALSAEFAERARRGTRPVAGRYVVKLPEEARELCPGLSAVGIDRLTIAAVARPTADHDSIWFRLAPGESSSGVVLPFFPGPTPPTIWLAALGAQQAIETHLLLSAWYADARQRGSVTIIQVERSASAAPGTSQEAPGRTKGRSPASRSLGPLKLPRKRVYRLPADDDSGPAAIVGEYGGADRANLARTARRAIGRHGVVAHVFYPKRREKFTPSEEKKEAWKLLPLASRLEINEARFPGSIEFPAAGTVRGLRIEIDQETGEKRAIVGYQREGKLGSLASGPTAEAPRETVAESLEAVIALLAVQVRESREQQSAA